MGSGGGIICLVASPSVTAALSFTYYSQISLRSHPRSSPPSSTPFPRLILTHYHFRPSVFHVTAELLHDAGAAAMVMGGAYALVSTFDNLTQRNLMEQWWYYNPRLFQFDSKSFTKTGNVTYAQFEQKIGPYIVRVAFHGFLANFQISVSTEARYFACLVPLLNCFRLVINGLSLTTDEGLTKSVTRGGNPEELLRGPLYYVLILILCALVFWRESPVGVISLAMMCGGDGVADIMGRRFGSHKIPYNQHKSWAGTISMFVVGFLTSIGMLYYFSVLGYFKLDWVTTVERVALISLVATAVESLPTTGFVDDNISVPLASMAMAVMFFCY